MKHTPGPWKVGFSDESGCGEGAYITDGADDVIVRGGSPEGDIDYGVLAEANARLIAQAPRLLEALKDVTKWAGKDRRKLARRGWTVEQQIQSLNRAAEVIAAAESD